MLPPRQNLWSRAPENAHGEGLPSETRGLKLGGQVRGQLCIQTCPGFLQTTPKPV